MSVVATYEGFKIVVAQILGSGQRLYEVVGIEDALYGRETQTTIEESKDIIKKHLGTYVETPTKVVEMSQEMFDQLQAGTLAMQENIRLQNIIDNAVESIDVIRATQLPELSGLTQNIDVIRDDIIPKIEAATADVLGLQDTLSGMTDNIRDSISKIGDVRDTIKETTERMGDVTGTLGDINETIKGITETMLGIPNSIKAITDAYEKSLAEKGGMFAGLGDVIGKVGLVSGILIGGIVVIKVLDVAK